MSTYTLTRTGAVPLVFEGELLAHSDGWYINMREGAKPRMRYHNLSVYRAKSGSLLVHLEYVCTVRSKRKYVEPGRSDVYECASVAQVGELLRFMGAVDEETLRCPATAPMYPHFRLGKRLVSVKEEFKRQLIKDFFRTAAERFRWQVEEVLGQLAEVCK